MDSGIDAIQHGPASVRATLSPVRLSALAAVARPCMGTERPGPERPRLPCSPDLDPGHDRLAGSSQPGHLTSNASADRGRSNWLSIAADRSVRTGQAPRKSSRRQLITRVVCQRVPDVHPRVPDVHPIGQVSILELLVRQPRIPEPPLQRLSVVARDLATVPLVAFVQPADVIAGGLFHAPHAGLRAALLALEVTLEVIFRVQAREQFRRWPAHAAELPPLPNTGKSSLLPLSLASHPATAAGAPFADRWQLCARRPMSKPKPRKDHAAQGFSRAPAGCLP